MRLTSAILLVLCVSISSDAATTVVTNQPPVYVDREVSQDNLARQEMKQCK